MIASIAADPTSMVHACTVDVEDYYHVSAFEGLVPRASWGKIPERVSRSTEKVLEILDDAGVRATFFVLGQAAQRCPKLIRKIRDAGHEVGCHSDDHRLIYWMTPEEFRSDLRSAKRRIEDLIGAKVVAFRAPSFSVTAKTLWALEVIREEGFVYDSSIYPIVHDRYGMPSAPPNAFVVGTPSGFLTEFPPTSFRMFGRRWPGCGGGYFRFYPYALTSWIIRHAAAEGRPANLYIHPWELDLDQPRMPGLRWSSRFRHYVGLEKTAPRLTRLLREFRFSTVTDTLGRLNPLPVYDIVGEQLVALTEAPRVAASRRIPVATP